MRHFSRMRLTSVQGERGEKMRRILVEIETDSEEPFRLIKMDIEQELYCCWNAGHFIRIDIAERGNEYGNDQT